MNTEMLQDSKNDQQPNLQPDAAELMDQHQAKDPEALLQEYLKKIPVPALTSDIKAKLTEAIALLTALNNDIVEKKEGITQKKILIAEKIEKLKSSGKININDDEFKKFEASIEEFIRLLDSMLVEVNRDTAFYQSFLSTTPPEHIFAIKQDSDVFEDHIDKRFKSIKKYVKNAKRDLAVSYSRYCYGFDGQIRHLTYIEQVLKHMKTNPSST